ncbi:MAG: hypothetical protein ACRDOL_34335 [Streptosporangiaceae bacterium]
MGDTRNAYRFLVPPLAAAGYRSAAADLRGHGESSTGWPPSWPGCRPGWAARS